MLHELARFVGAVTATALLSATAVMCAPAHARAEYVDGMYVSPYLQNEEPQYRKERSYPLPPPDAEHIGYGVEYGATEFAANYCPDLSSTQDHRRLGDIANFEATNAEYDRRVANLHTRPYAIDAICAELLSQYPYQLYVAGFEHAHTCSSFKDPIVGVPNEWKRGLYSTPRRDYAKEC